jgi:hypothetical protein
MGIIDVAQFGTENYIKTKFSQSFCSTVISETEMLEGIETYYFTVASKSKNCKAAASKHTTGQQKGDGRFERIE